MSGLFDGTNPLVLVAVATAFLSVVLLLLWQSIAGNGRRRLEKRLERAIGAPRALQTVADAPRARKVAQDSSIKGLDYLVKRLVPRPARLRARLNRTGHAIPLGAYVMVSVLTGLATYFLLAAIAGTGYRIAILFGLTLGLALPHLVVGVMIARRRKRFIRELPDAIDIIVRGVRSGLPATESMHIIVREMSGPVADEFAHITDLLKLGLPLGEILNECVERLDIQEMNFFVVTLNIQRETGGNLAETLENLVDILRRRSQMRMKIRALSSEARASAFIIGALPFVMFGIIYSTNADYVRNLMVDPRGVFMLIVGGVSLSLGIFTMAKMIRMDI